MPVVHHDHNALSTTTILAIYGAVVATGAAVWNGLTWRWSHAFDVRVSIEAPSPFGVRVDREKYELVVVARNTGRTHEAVQEIWLRYLEHDLPETLPSLVVPVPPSEGDLPPNRNVRKTVDLLAARFAAFVPGEITAVVRLESGRHVVSEPYHPVRFAEKPDQAEDDSDD